MKVRVHLRVGKGERVTMVQASIKPSERPLTGSSGVPVPTVAFAVDLDLPDAMFKRAAHVIAEIKVPEEAARIAAEVVQ